MKEKKRRITEKVNAIIFLRSLSASSNIQLKDPDYF